MLKTVLLTVILNFKVHYVCTDGSVYEQTLYEEGGVAVTMSKQVKATIDGKKVILLQAGKEIGVVDV